MPFLKRPSINQNKSTRQKNVLLANVGGLKGHKLKVNRGLLVLFTIKESKPIVIPISVEKKKERERKREFRF